MCLLPKVDVPDPPKPPAPTQAAKAPTRAWAADPSANRPLPAVLRSPATARPSTAAPGSMLGR